MWLTDFRAQHGLDLGTLGYCIRVEGLRRNPPLRVSDQLLYMLERLEGFRTVPKLADLIAEVCGATAGQRDALVLERYRGTWTPKEGAGGNDLFRHGFAVPPSPKGEGWGKKVDYYAQMVYNGGELVGKGSMKDG